MWRLTEALIPVRDGGEGRDAGEVEQDCHQDDCGACGETKADTRHDARLVQLLLCPSGQVSAVFRVRFTALRLPCATNGTHHHADSCTRYRQMLTPWSSPWDGMGWDARFP